MTNEERDIISQFIARVGGVPAPSSGFGAAAQVPAPNTPPLPPVDREADALIGQLHQRYPEAGYRMTQLAFVQEQGLIQAQSRIQQLEQQLAQAQQAMNEARQQAQQAQQAAPQGGGGFFSGLFGGGRQAPPPPPPNPGPWGGQPGYRPPQQQQYAPPPYAPPPQFAPGYQPGMFQQSGSGFLGSALTTAAGVAGGMVVGSLLTNMFTGNHGAGGMGAGMGATGGAWGGGGAAPVTDSGAWDSSAAGGAATSNQDFVDNSSWDQPQAQDTSWSDNSGGGWDSGGGGSDDSF